MPAFGVQSSVMENLISIRGLTVAFDGVPALRGIDLDVQPGEAVGLVGESGCGKSVTWLAALGLLPGHAAVGGSVRLGGQELLGAPAQTLDKVRGGRVAMIFQDPASALNPVIRVGRQVEEALRLHRGLTGAAARAEARRLFEQVGIPDPAGRLNSFAHEMSGGQNQRVMIAMALAGRPDLLIADEPTTALDATIQAQILDLLRRVQQDHGMALVLISHDLGVVADLCSKVGVMYAGRMIEHGSAEQIFQSPSHPYTRGLIATLPNPADMPPGCAFAPRCTQAGSDCDAGTPDLRRVAGGHRAACLRIAA